jgi:hypothetical protein
VRTVDFPSHCWCELKWAYEAYVTGSIYSRKYLFILLCD